jgi:hypothetical protein
MLPTQNTCTYLYSHVDQLYTGFIMAASGLGYLICKRGGYISMPFGFAFISAPILALYQKRELDFY